MYDRALIRDVKVEFHGKIVKSDLVVWLPFYISTPKTVGRHELRSKLGWSTERICMLKERAVFYNVKAQLYFGVCILTNIQLWQLVIKWITTSILFINN